MGIGGVRMQDRFRFRVWNKVNKEMIYNAEIAYDGMNYNTSWQIDKNTNDGWVDCFGYYLDYPEDYEVMQCTGMKDHTGKLIYEGDIVFYKIGSNKCRDVVKWSDDRCSWVKGYQDLCTYKKYCEVIGNIYENPELIGGADKCI